MSLVYYYYHRERQREAAATDRGRQQEILLQANENLIRTQVIDEKVERIKCTVENFMSTTSSKDECNSSREEASNVHRLCPLSSSFTELIGGAGVREEFVSVDGEQQHGDNYEHNHMSSIKSHGTTMMAENSCTICLEPFMPGDEVAWAKGLNCHHCFHFDSLVPWLLMSHGVSSMPNGIPKQEGLHDSSIQQCWVSPDQH